MKLRPVIALVDDETWDRLRPLIDELRDRFAAADKNVAWERTMLLNGWDGEMIAWGLVIAAASREDLEIVGPGDDR